MRRVLRGPVRFYSLLILAIIAIVMFETSCNQEDTIERPSAKFILQGTVLSAKDTLPIKDIQVVILSDTIGIDTVLTDQNGKYKLIDSLGIPAEVTYVIKFRDVDNELISSNERIDSTLTYQFKNPTFLKGDGHWFIGETSSELNVILKSKKNEVINSSN
jgi:putative lipoprotein (rSAM/lipoprotein system)